MSKFAHYKPNSAGVILPNDAVINAYNSESGALRIENVISTAPQNFLPAVNELLNTAIAVDTAIDDYSITVDSTAGISVGNHIRIFNTTIGPLPTRFYFGNVVSLPGGNVINLDSPLDYAYLDGDQVTVSSKDMNVDGSVTPVEFILRTGTPSIESVVNCTQIVLVCETSTTPALDEFGDLTRLTNGLVFRKELDDQTQNIFNVKDNKEIMLLGYELEPLSNFTQQSYGFKARVNFGNVGVAIATGATEDMKFIVQDDLTALTSLQAFFLSYTSPPFEPLA